MRALNEVPIPWQMQTLERDRRGYPIPVNVLRDSDGRPHFTINNQHVVESLLRKRQCAICGQGWGEGPNPGRWCVGGPMSAFHKHGAYLDTPIHHDCAVYALQVCPYLAAPVYTKRIDAKTVDPAKLPGAMLFEDRTMIPDRPEVFVLTNFKTFSRTPQGYIHPTKPLLGFELWKDGEIIPAATAQMIVSGIAYEIGPDFAA